MKFQFKFNILKYIHAPVFFVSLVFGLIAVYLTVPENKIIYVYPTPENVDTIQYKDKTNNCFAMQPNEIPCPKSKSEISKIPAQS
jgi:hypothetical protein